jgi:hypothetical protein
LNYDSLAVGIRQQVAISLPPDCTVAVISKGDPELLDLDGRRAWHLPQCHDNVYAGHHPADSREAIDQLERLRTRGADYLLIPAPSFWWLDFYTEFRAHLENRYRCLSSDQVCRIYSLATSEGNLRPAPPELDGNRSGGTATPAP